MMKGMIVCFTVLMFCFMTHISTSPLPLKGKSSVSDEQEKRTTKIEELLPGSQKETPDGSGRKVVFLCRSACGDNASSATKQNSSGCQYFVGKLSGKDKAYKRTFKYCSNCPCNPEIKELRESNTQTDLQAANSFRSPTLISNPRNSDTETRNTQYMYPKGDSENLRFSQKYNPRSKSSESGFVPVPGPYGFKSSTTKYPRLSQYRSDSYEDIEEDYHETSFDDEDLLGSGHFEILRGGIFSYNDNNNNNHLGYGHRGEYRSSFNYVPKKSKGKDHPFSNRFPYSFPDILSTERRSELTQATNSRGVLSHLFAVTSDLDTAD